MRRKKNSLFLIVLLLLLGQQVNAQTGSDTRKHRVIIQLTSNDTLAWKGLMNNLKNLKAGWGDSVEVEVVAHGPGIELLMINKTTQQEKIRQFRSMGIVFMACENTIRERNIPKENILPESGFVKMGVGEVILKQEAGWSYLKGGF